MSRDGRKRHWVARQAFAFTRLSEGRASIWDCMGIVVCRWASDAPDFREWCGKEAHSCTLSALRSCGSALDVRNQTLRVPMYCYKAAVKTIVSSASASSKDRRLLVVR